MVIWTWTRCGSATKCRRRYPPAFSRTNNPVRLTARNISGATFNLAAPLSMQVVKRRVS